MKNFLILLLICTPITTMAVKPVPSDPKATPEAVKLYRNMMTLQHKGLMFGHQDDLAYRTKWYGEEDFVRFYNDPKTLFQKDVRKVFGK